MTIFVKLCRDWNGPPDKIGQFVFYPKGWTGEMPDDAAGYALAIGIAEPTKPLPPDLVAGIETLKEIVALFRAERVEPTFTDVYDAVARLAGEQQGETA